MKVVQNLLKDILVLEFLKCDAIFEMVKMFFKWSQATILTNTHTNGHHSEQIGRSAA